MPAKVDKDSFSQYLKEAKSWETDKIKELQRSNKQAWLVALGAGLLALISIVTVAVLGPQKTAVPYVIRVDNATGAVDVVSALKDSKTTYDEAMNKYNLQWYVRWREGYSMPLVEEYYKNVALTSSQDEQRKYLATIEKGNPKSPLNVYKDEGKVEIKIKSTSFIKDDIALVRYTRNELLKGVTKTTHWAATIVFAYGGSPMAEEDRAINPLGFQVLEYRNDPDQEVSLEAEHTNMDSIQPKAGTNNKATPITVPAIR